MENTYLKYTRVTYENKICELESCVSRLQNHLSTLEELKGQVRNFWDDPQTPKYLTRLTTAISGVRNAMDQTTKLLGEYHGIVNTMEEAKAAGDEIISDIGSALSALGIAE